MPVPTEPVTEQRWTFSDADWPDEWGKGLDDVLANGFVPIVTPVLPSDPCLHCERYRPTAPPADGAPHPAEAALSPGQRSTARAAARTAQWYAARRGEWVKISELYPSSAKGIQLADQTTKITTIDLRDALSKEDLTDLIGVAEGVFSPVHERVRSCGWEAAAICKDHPEEHGERRRTKVTCKLGAHASCPTLTTVKLRQTELPDLEGTAGYRSVWMEFYIPTAEAINDVGDVFKGVIRDVSEWGSKATKRARYKGMLLSRGLAFHVARAGSMGQLRLLLREDTPGAAEQLVWDASERFGAIVVNDYRTPFGEVAILQAMEDSASSLIGMGEIEREELFVEWWYAVKRSKLFQGYAGLYTAIKERVKEAPPTCDVCGASLFLRPIPPKETLDGEADLLAVAASPLPPPGERVRQEVLAW